VTRQQAFQILSFVQEHDISVLLTQYCVSDKIKKNEMGGERAACRGGKSPVQGFGGET